MTKKEIIALTLGRTSKIMKQQNISRSEAYKIAKEQVMNEIEEASKPKQHAGSTHASVQGCSKSKLERMLQKGTVIIEYINAQGKRLIAKATTFAGKIPTNRKIAGKATTTNAAEVVFYDRRHGCWKTVNVNNVISIKEYNVF